MRNSKLLWIPRSISLLMCLALFGFYLYVNINSGNICLGVLLFFCSIGLATILSLLLKKHIPVYYLLTTVFGILIALFLPLYNKTEVIMIAFLLTMIVISLFLIPLLITNALFFVFSKA